MEKKITCYMPFSDKESAECTISSLKYSGIVSKVFVAGGKDLSYETNDPLVLFMKSDGFASTSAIKMIAESVTTEFTLIYSKAFSLDMGKLAIDRMLQVCDFTDAGMVYSDYYENRKCNLSPHPLIYYHEGSLRDDFNFGSLTLYRTSVFKNACKMMNQEFRFAGLYDLRLKVSQRHSLVHIP